MKRSTIIIAAIFLIAISLGAPVRAQDTSSKDPYAGDIWSRSTLTGDWGGFRNEWAEKGVTIDLNVTQIGQGVVNGGKSGAWVSELLPYTAKMVDDMAIIRSMHTEAINHEPAITFIQTGSMIAGKPCIGAWVAYGLGTTNKDLPTFVVLNASHSHPKAGVQAISAKLWSAGFLSAKYAGVG